MTKLAVILVLMVLLPTAMLSLLAVRMLQQWEMVLHARFEAVTARAVREVSEQLTGELESDWFTLRTAVADSLAPRGRLRDIDAVAANITSMAPWIDTILIFMDPLGFIYPERSDEDRSALVGILRRELVTGNRVSGPEKPLVFRLDDDLYCFGTLRQGLGLTIGYRIRESWFQRRLREITADISGDDLRLEIAPWGGDRFPVLVSDPFSPLNESPSTGTARAREGPSGDAVTAALAAPFDFLTVTAAWRDPGQIARAVAWQSRLYGWGLALLVMCVIGGVVLMMRQTAIEIRRLRERHDLVMAVSHDLRTPIAAMKMMAESLYLGHVPERAKQREFLQTLIAETDRLADMAERVLLLVRHERRAVSQTMQHLDAAQLALTTVNAYRERAALSASPASRIQSLIADGVPPVQADRRALTAVLTNLMDNALSHGAAPRAGASPNPPPWLAVRLCVDTAVRRGRVIVRFAVRDFGPGIARRDTKRIFRRFQRGFTATTAGSGLGLALCRDMVRAHGGWMEVWSEPGRGSEFRVCLRASGEAS